MIALYPYINITRKDKTMKVTKSGLELKTLIEKATQKDVITNREYEEIMQMASEDGMIDSHEKKMLSQLQNMIENGTLKKIKG